MYLAARKLRGKPQAELKAAARYNEIRRARYANMAAEKAREKARVAVEAVERGEYPKPRAVLVEKTAQQKQIEAERRAAVVQETKARGTREKMEATVEKHGSEVRCDPGVWNTQRGAERDEKQAIRVQEQCEAKLGRTIQHVEQIRAPGAVWLR